MEGFLWSDALLNWLMNALYDISKFMFGYIIVRLLYDGLYKWWRFGKYSLQVRRDDDAGNSVVLAERKMTTTWAEKILKDENELSVYVKGVVSPFAYLKMDVASTAAFDKGLIKIDKHNKLITVNLSCCPDAVKE